MSGKVDRRRTYTADQEAELVALYRQRLSFKEIARRTGRTERSARWKVAHLGVCDRRHVNSPAFLGRVRGLHALGWHTRRIGRELGCDAETVTRALKLLGLEANRVKKAAMTEEELGLVRRRHAEGWGVPRIARELGRHCETVYRALRRMRLEYGPAPAVRRARGEGSS